MAANNYLAGKYARVNVGVNTFTFSKVKIAMETQKVEVTNFLSGGFQQWVMAITGCTLTFGAYTYNAGNMPFVSGALYAWTITFTAGIALLVNAWLTNLTVDIDVKGAQPVELTAVSEGPFLCKIV